MQNKNLRALCECAMFTAAALALSYAKVDVAALGGSISLVMIPLVLCAIRWGVGYGLAAAASIPSNAFQGVIGLVLGVALYQALAHIPAVKRSIQAF